MRSVALVPEHPPPEMGLYVKALADLALVVVGVALSLELKSGVSGWDLRHAAGRLAVGRARVALAASTPAASCFMVVYTMSDSRRLRQRRASMDDFPVAFLRS